MDGFSGCSMRSPSQTIFHTQAIMDPARSALNHKVIQLGKIVDEQLNVFHVETAINNRMLIRQSPGPFSLKNDTATISLTVSGRLTSPSVSS